MSNPITLRQLAGAPDHLSGLVLAKTALVLIDIQEEYFTPNSPLFLPNAMVAAQQAATLLAWARAQSVQVIHVQHIAAQLESPVFTPNSTRIQLHHTVMPINDEELISKQKPSSFFATPLQEKLENQGVQSLIIAGFMSHMCVSTTARDAAQLGYNVVVAEDACTTRDLVSSVTGKIIPYTQVHDVALTEISDAFAYIAKVEEIIS